MVRRVLCYAASVVLGLVSACAAADPPACSGAGGCAGGEGTAGNGGGGGARAGGSSGAGGVADTGGTSTPGAGGGVNPATDGSSAAGGASATGGSAGARDAEAAQGGGAAGSVDAGAGESAVDASPDAAAPGSESGGPVTTQPIVYVGGFARSYPFRIYDLNTQTGAMKARAASYDLGPNPSYIALDPSRTHLYVANESDDATGGLTAARIGPDGSLTKLNHQTGTDLGFTYVAVDPTGHYALAASYNGGSVSVFPINADGSLGPQIDNKDFGATAQTHCVGFDLTGKYAFVVNKGRDEVAQFLLGADGKLTAHAPAQVTTAAGAGPRHIAIDPTGKLAFVVTELSSTLVPYALSNDGKLTAGSALSTLPAGYSGMNTGAHVELSASGAFAYVSNRGHDSIAVFAVNQASGAPSLVEHEPTRGKTPRDFDVDPRGAVLVVANQDSQNLAVFKIEASGALTALGDVVAGPPSPSAVQIYYPAR